jgi:hypothetical protein
MTTVAFLCYSHGKYARTPLPLSLHHLLNTRTTVLFFRRGMKGALPLFDSFKRESLLPR